MIIYIVSYYILILILAVLVRRNACEKNNYGVAKQFRKIPYEVEKCGGNGLVKMS